jgi:hypothetical protein
MVTFRCRTCGTEQELPFGSGWFFCDHQCHDEFAQVVEHLMAGGDASEIGVDPRSRLFGEAVRAVQARRRREVVERRELKAREVERSRPRPLRPLDPC